MSQENNAVVTMVRIVGNELPPRHKVGSHLEQLRFILQNEPVNPSVKKIWLLNRIVDDALATSLTDELKANHCDFISLPFDAEEYVAYAAQKPSRNLFGFKESHDAAISRKAGYIIAINRARNKAMELAKGRSQWTIPLDGGCCFNNESFEKMLEQASTPKRAVYGIPTYRMKQWDEWSNFNVAAHPMHESMLMLPSDMLTPFEEDRLYGNSDKLATIKQLFPRSALKQTSHATIVSDPACYAGYVLRLPSGNSDAEGKYKKRVRLRKAGLAGLVEQTEAMLSQKGHC